MLRCVCLSSALSLTLYLTGFSTCSTNTVSADYSAYATAYGYQGSISSSVSNFAQVKLQATFTQSAANEPTSIQVTGSNLPAGTFALHVHTWGDMTSVLNSDGQTTKSPSTALNETGVGGHFNPFNSSHGCYPDPVRHVGDIGNLTCSGSGTCEANFTSTLINLAPSKSSIIGRALVMHSKPDTCVQPTGNAGTPAAQGVVGRMNLLSGSQEAAAEWSGNLVAAFVSQNTSAETAFYEIISVIRFYKTSDSVNTTYRVTGSMPNQQATAASLQFDNYVGESSDEVAVQNWGSANVASDSLSFDAQLPSYYTAAVLAGNSLKLTVTGGSRAGEYRATIGTTSNTEIKSQSNNAIEQPSLLYNSDTAAYTSLTSITMAVLTALAVLTL